MCMWGWGGWVFSVLFLESFPHPESHPVLSWVKKAHADLPSPPGSPLPSLQVPAALNLSTHLLLTGKYLEFCWSLPGNKKRQWQLNIFSPMSLFAQGMQHQIEGIEYQVSTAAADDKGLKQWLGSLRSDHGNNGKSHLCQNQL